MKRAIKSLDGRKNCKTATHRLRVIQTTAMLKKWIKKNNPIDKNKTPV